MTDQFNRVLNNEYRTRNFELWGFLILSKWVAPQCDFPPWFLARIPLYE